MTFERIQLQFFRNYTQQEFCFVPGINPIVGPNGIGKSSLLEALSILSIGRSFRTHKLCDTIHSTADQFILQANFTQDSVEQTISYQYSPKQKRICHNQTPYATHTPLLGLLPSIVLSSHDQYLIEGSPQERRRFLNIHLAQHDPQYTLHLTRYTQALRQRNCLLKQRITRGIEAWESVMAESARYLQKQRSCCIRTLSETLPKEYEKLTGTQLEVPSLSYTPSLPDYDEQRQKDLEYQYTRYGPHRDDWMLYLNEGPAKVLASEGQKQCLIYALRFTQCRMIEQAFLAIDDFAAHLDRGRQERLLEQLQTFGQVFLTTPVPMEALPTTGLHSVVLT